MYNLNSKKIILGSKSPRRSQLLSEAGFNVEVRSQDVAEDFDENMPVIEVPLMLANRKATALIATLNPDEILITADSVVILDNKIYNKPQDYNDGCRILTELSGRTHTVATGVCILTTAAQNSFTVKTEVTFEEMSIEEIDFYLTNHQPYDKAGAYGIQDWIGLCKVASIKGSYSNVMGLPMKEVYEGIRVMM
ncbi:MAG: septum formation protein Maf [Saprospiraceae bacterium]|jgi:septum formation protein|nr:septum formation protein Maf [Saprospiraceae bacterium]